MHSAEKKIQYLVVDSGGFIRNAPLGTLSDHVISLSEVVDEIKDKSTKERLQVLPYDLQFKSASSEAIAKVTEFSKKTGDFPALSATDIKVIALTYDYHLQYAGKDSLNEAPAMTKTIHFYKPGDQNHSQTKMAGFFSGNSDDQELDISSIEDSSTNNSNTDDLDEFSSFNFWREPIPSVEEDFIPLFATAFNEDDFSQCLNDYLSTRSYVVGYQISHFDFAIHERIRLTSNLLHLSRWSVHVQSYKPIPMPDNLSEKSIENLMDLIMKVPSDSVDKISDSLKDTSLGSETTDSEFSPSEEKVEDNENRESDSASATETIEEEIEIETEDDDDEGWITPGNLKQKNKMMLGEWGDESDGIVVAIMTTDFAMQNVSKQLGLKVVSVDGYEIRKTKTWILRCYACFNTTSLMHKKFCPKCGNKTLKRVSVSLNEDGSQEIHISTRTRLTGRGKKFSLPKPKGGKHAVNPILSEDQCLPQQRQTRLARQKTDALSDDYLAGSSPFILRDVNSKSAMVGTPGVGTMNNFYWMKKNPNEVGHGTGNRRKKKNRN